MKDRSRQRKAQKLLRQPEEQTALKDVVFCYFHKTWPAVGKAPDHTGQVFNVCETCKYILDNGLAGFKCKYCGVAVKSETDFTPVHNYHKNGCPRLTNYINASSIGGNYERHGRRIEVPDEEAG